MIELDVSVHGTTKWIVDKRPLIKKRVFHNRFGSAAKFKSNDIEWWLYGNPSLIDSVGTVYMYFINGKLYNNYLEYLVDAEEYRK